MSGHCTCGGQQQLASERIDASLQRELDQFDQVTELKETVAKMQKRQKASQKALRAKNIALEKELAELRAIVENGKCCEWNVLQVPDLLDADLVSADTSSMFQVQNNSARGDSSTDAEEHTSESSDSDADDKEDASDGSHSSSNHEEEPFQTEGDVLNATDSSSRDNLAASRET